MCVSRETIALSPASGSSPRRRAFNIHVERMECRMQSADKVQSSESRVQS